MQRLRTLQHKKEAQAKAARRDIATLLEKGKLETARIKVETIINEDVYVELLELLELYCELLLARFGILDQNSRTPDPGISEGVCSIIRAAPSTELKELHILRDILMHKYGREFSAGVMENRDGCVSERVMRKLDLGTPSEELVDAYLSEIAKAYGVPWLPSSIAGASKDEVADEANASADASNSEKATESITESSTNNKSSSEQVEPAPGKQTPKDEFEALSERFAALKKRI